MSNIKKLKKIFSEASASDSDIVISCYKRDASPIIGNPDSVVWPIDIESLRKLIIFAADNKINLTPRGAGTGISGGSVPEDGIVVDVSKMNKIIQINIREKKAKVEAGVSLTELNKVLERYSLVFPILPHNKDSTQIGSMIATNASGLGSRQYGDMGKNIISVEYLDGTGKIYSSKDARPVLGMEGTTGIITKAEIRLAKPIPMKSLTIFSSDDIGPIIKTVKRYSSFKTALSIDFFDKNIAKLFNLDEKYHLFIRFSDSTGKFKEEPDIKKKLAFTNDFETVLFKKKFPIIDEIKVDIEKLDKLTALLEENKIPFYGDLSIGLIHLRYMYEKEKALQEKILESCSSVGCQVCSGGDYGLRKKRYIPQSHASKTKELKKKYDPKGIMNRGKII